MVQNVPAFSMKEKNKDIAAEVAIKKKCTIEMSFQRVIHSVNDRQWYTWKLFEVVEQFFNPFLNLEPYFARHWLYMHWTHFNLKLLKLRIRILRCTSKIEFGLILAQLDQLGIFSSDSESDQIGCKVDDTKLVETSLEKQCYKYFLQTYLNIFIIVLNFF